MSKYDDYSWIKVPRGKTIWAGDLSPSEKVVTEKHHIDETSFLIEEVRKLAKVIQTAHDELCAASFVQGTDSKGIHSAISKCREVLDSDQTR